MVGPVDMRRRRHDNATVPRCQALLLAAFHTVVLLPFYSSLPMPWAAGCSDGAAVQPVASVQLHGQFLTAA